MNNRLVIIIVLLMLALGWLCFGAQLNFLGDRLSPPHLIKQATQLMARNSQSQIANSQGVPSAFYVFITLPLTNSIQFSTDLVNWTTVLVTNQPAFTVVISNTGIIGFVRNVTEDSYGPSSILVSTNTSVP